MIIEFISKNYVPNEKLKEIVTKKVDKLDKFFENDQKVKILFKQINEVYILELTIVVDHGVLRAEVSSDNMYSNIDLALPKLEKQIIKHHKKIITKSKKLKAMPSDYEKPVEKAKTIVRSKLYDLTPMSVEDAVEELELIGHSFYVFLNKETSSTSVVYLRNDGNYGLIETRI